MVTRSRLPRATELIVDRAKVVDYLLASAHPDGGPKSRFFRAFGFSAQQWEVLADALRSHGKEREIIEEKTSRWGRKFSVSCSINTPDGRNPCVLSVWIEEGGAPARLVTAYPGQT